MLLLQNMNAPSKDTLQKWAIHFTGLTCMHFFFTVVFVCLLIPSFVHTEEFWTHSFNNLL